MVLCTEASQVSFAAASGEESRSFAMMKKHPSCSAEGNQRLSSLSVQTAEMDEESEVRSTSTLDVWTVSVFLPKIILVVIKNILEEECRLCLRWRCTSTRCQCWFIVQGFHYGGTDFLLRLVIRTHPTFSLITKQTVYKVGGGGDDQIVCYSAVLLLRPGTWLVRRGWCEGATFPS